MVKNEPKTLNVCYYFELFPKKPSQEHLVVAGGYERPFCLNTVAPFQQGNNQLGQQTNAQLLAV